MKILLFGVLRLVLVQFFGFILTMSRLFRMNDENVEEREVNKSQFGLALCPFLLVNSTT